MSIWRAEEDQITDVTGCDWPMAWTDEECKTLADLPPETRALVERSAVQMLWSWTGRRFGVCTTTIRPCRAERPPYARRSTFDGRGGTTVSRHRDWLSVGCGCPSRACRHSGVILPGPVVSVEKITLDGSVMAPTDYAMVGGVLVRHDGTGQTWPTQQDQLDPPTAEGAWEVVYVRGIPVPAGGQLAGGRLSCELAKAYAQDRACKLPQRLQTVARQGITVGVVDPFEVDERTRTGIWVIDSWVESTLTKTPRAVVSTPENRRWW